MEVIIEITIEEVISDNEVLEAVNEYKATEEKIAEIKQLINAINNDEHPLKGLRCAVCGSSTQ